MRNADRIEAGFGHLGEVAIDDTEVVVLLFLLVRPERAVRGATDVELVVPREDELASRGWPPNPRFVT